MLSPATTTASWSPVKKFIFRFLFLYFFLYCFPFPFDSFDFTKPVCQPYYNFIDWLIPLVGKSWFHIRAFVAWPMFDKVDDSGYGLVYIYLVLLISGTAAIAWSIADRKRKNYEKLHQWLRLYLRYFLVAYLFGYGFIKVFPSQFQPLSASRLVMTVGDQSPMLLAWNFMGYSTFFTRFMGIFEVLAGFFLLFRRTTTLGAILASGTFGFIALMDFCFNVPVRLLSSHLLLISIFLILGDRLRLLNVFLLNKPAPADDSTPLVATITGRRILAGLQLVFAVCLLYKTISESIETEKKIGPKAPHGPLYGVYNTVSFIRNRDTLPPLDSDSTRWKKLVVDGGSWRQSGIVQLNTDKMIKCDLQVDTLKRILRIQNQADTADTFSLHYFLPDPDHLVLEGPWKKDSIKVVMKKYGLENYLLHREKFLPIAN